MFDQEKYLQSEKDLFIKGLNKCEHDVAIYKLEAQAEQIDRFIKEATPLLDYVQGEIKRNEKRSEMYAKITEHVLGAVVLSILGFIGSIVIERVSHYLKTNY